MQIQAGTLALFLLAPIATAASASSSTSKSTHATSKALAASPLDLHPKQTTTTRPRSHSASASRKHSSIAKPSRSLHTTKAASSSSPASKKPAAHNKNAFQRVAIPPLLSPKQANTSENNLGNNNSTYLLNTFSGRIQFHIGSLFESLVQASVPQRGPAGSAQGGTGCATRVGVGVDASCAASSTSSSTASKSGATAGTNANKTGVGMVCECGCAGDASAHDGSEDDDDDDDDGTDGGSTPAPRPSPTVSVTNLTSLTVPVTTKRPSITTTTPPPAKPTPTKQASCFPALDFDMPDGVPDQGLDGWWCDMRDEYAFLGFSYDLSSCPSLPTLRADFKRMRQQFHARYVRLYSACDRPGMNDDLVTAAWENGLGLHMLIWFGFEGGEQWRARKRELLSTIRANPRAPFVVRAVVVGSEPLFDAVLPPDELAAQIMDIKDKLSDFTGKGLTGMQVTLSEMPWGFMSNGNTPKIFKAMDIVEGNILPFFDQRATTGGQAWSIVSSAYTYFQQQAKGKKVLYTQIGWPSTDEVWKANSASAKASLKSERTFFNLLDHNCEWFKAGAQGGVGWFAHIWDDEGLPGWGILDYAGKLKFDFAPRTMC